MRDDPDGTPDPLPIASASTSYSPTGLAYITDVAPSVLAAASPASEEPDTSMPGNSSRGKDGISFESLHLVKLASVSDGAVTVQKELIRVV
jgi:hypothetical protein